MSSFAVRASLHFWLLMYALMFPLIHGVQLEAAEASDAEFQKWASYLDEKSTTLRSIAIGHVATDWPDRATAPLLRRLNVESEYYLRCELVKALAGLKDPQAREGVRSATKDPAADVRSAAIIALANAHDDRAVDVAVAALTDQQKVRDTAFEALARLKSGKAVAALIAIPSSADPVPTGLSIPEGPVADIDRWSRALNCEAIDEFHGCLSVH